MHGAGCVPGRPFRPLAHVEQDGTLVSGALMGIGWSHAGGAAAEENIIGSFSCGERGGRAVNCRNEAR